MAAAGMAVEVMAVATVAATAAVAVAAMVAVAPSDIEVEAAAVGIRVAVATSPVAIQVEAAASLGIPEEGSDRAAARIAELGEGMSDAAEADLATRIPAQLSEAVTTIPSGEAGTRVPLAEATSLPHAAVIPARWDDGMAHLVATLRSGHADILQTGQVDRHTARSGDMAVAHTVSDHWVGTAAAVGTVLLAGTRVSTGFVRVMLALGVPPGDIPVVSVTVQVCLVAAPTDINPA